MPRHIRQSPDGGWEEATNCVNIMEGEGTSNSGFNHTVDMRRIQVGEDLDGKVDCSDIYNTISHLISGWDNRITKANDL